jgi:hypothetical protein
MTDLISKPGAYPDVSNEDYHGREICVRPSISSTGLKLISAKSERHYWATSTLNPNRPVRKDKKHFRIGSALHDILLLNERFQSHYYVLPEGYNARAKEWTDWKLGAEYAERKGRTVISKVEYDMTLAMADQVVNDELAYALLTAGTPEMTLVAFDPETGAYMRARPDVLPTTMEIIPDIKTAIDASLDAYERAATRFGYFQSAAHYLDVIEQLYGPAKRKFVLVTVEKEYPFIVTIDQLDEVDIDFARLRNRAALNKFAACLKTGEWPGYTSREKPIRHLMMTNYERALINQAIERGELSYA